MLKQFLTNIRKNRTIGAERALSQLGQGWSAEGEGTVKKEFKFENFEDASNFIFRYTNYCNKVNLNPQWFNVYNTVRVTINNDEFGAISTKDVEVAKYLDLVSQVKLFKQYEQFDLHTVIESAKIDHDIDLVRNNQKETTALYGVPKDYLKLTAQ